MSSRLTIKLELTHMVWATTAKNALDTIRSYCPFLNSGELAGAITERALNLDAAYKSGESAQNIDAMLLDLKQLATGLTLNDAVGMGFIVSYEETLSNAPFFRAAISVDLLPDGVLSNEK